MQWLLLVIGLEFPAVLSLVDCSNRPEGHFIGGVEVFGRADLDVAAQRVQAKRLGFPHFVAQLTRLLIFRDGGAERLE